ncbi:MAG: 30S ribosomal protein S8 [Parcubacteria group bacterium GW2011_GWF2_39_8b]|uniref:Small ribosomal subunit protein uS8 n=3 Tax=Candidatus Zambryskiibacteriota TaxID=1817925 RepID=A0A1G2T5V9_9BACT|nr:MAG: 30S ribosomal protein S8 [Parcubacteria group bacterium GW2011_GWF2_39_8b]KKR46208.1 MAG: 30S ribosomal protein S8 [Parcubacteria group bacterium GW2011_GWA2_40_14]OHA92665.1 MAG: 30S ribosomal protein S8 [Candidatus Zambryskibacteria bacterium RIFCSPHIGHO2_02_38_10.5]OHA97264.1 MAG: 30S ribosomal protein S8 [Candidatus Zambryskibacteria bacterium RIFCSPHIGHO2_12_FULL_38_37]OHA97393.1 MAG: 30S ribosomal protein S8 [Candidatus Zambryskibacteria bacterium RIFCSPHIGHO2_02_FULL_39_82]OHB08
MDPIADMIVRIKNASDSKKKSVVFPHSKLKLTIADVLMKEGFIKSFSKKGKKLIKFIEVELIHTDGVPRIHGVERVSKSSKRIYQKSKDIRKVKSGMGALVLSTPKGIMTDKQARIENVGGEALFKVW